MHKIPIDKGELERIVAAALAEDVGKGDITSQLTLSDSLTGAIRFVAQEDMVACGTFLAEAVYSKLASAICVSTEVEEGDFLKKGAVLAQASGQVQTLLTGERVTLNLMQRMTGVATLTRRYVDAVKDTKAIILDTRKTMPGLRALDKYAVRIGGGQNHRLRLDDMILIKDNHIAAVGSIAEAVRKARAGSALMIEVECDTLAQVEEAIAAMPDRILLDNMPIEILTQAVRLIDGRIATEASGNVSLKTVRAIAETGVDYISAGKITHSAPAVDISAEIAR